MRNEGAMPAIGVKPAIPFWRFSSYNKKGGKAHPIVTRRANQILDLWAAITPMAVIADRLEISETTVKAHLRRARRRGDPRAHRPECLTRPLIDARKKRTQIVVLKDAGYENRQIAAKVRCSLRLVQVVVREQRKRAR